MCYGNVEVFEPEPQSHVIRGVISGTADTQVYQQSHCHVAQHHPARHHNAITLHYDVIGNQCLNRESYMV